MAVEHPKVGVNGIIAPAPGGGWQFKPLPDGQPGPVHRHDGTPDKRLQAFLAAARDWRVHLRSQVAAK